MVEKEVLKKVLRQAVGDAGVTVPELCFPIVVRGGVNAAGRTLRFIMNYSAEPAAVPAPYSGAELLTGTSYQAGERISLPDWGVCILEESGI